MSFSFYTAFKVYNLTFLPWAILAQGKNVRLCTLEAV